MSMNKFFMCMLMINNKYKDNKYSESRNRESKQEFVIEVRQIAYIPALSTTT